MLDLPITNIGNIQRELYLFYRIGKDLKTMKDPTFFPYFFQLDEKGLFKTIDGKKAKKIICSRPSDLSKRRDEESYEADLIYTKRYAIDKIGTFLKCELKYSFIDIEVICPELPQASNPIYPISCISCSNSYTGKIKTFFINDYLDPRIAVENYEKQEKQLLDDFVKWLRDNQFDFIAAWNMINFDYAYLCGRYKFVMGTDLPNILSPIAQSRPLGEILFIPQGLGIVDYLEWYKKVYKGEQSYALDNIAQTHLNETGYEKVDFSRLSAKIKEKNINDVRRMMELEKKFKLIDYYDELRRMGKCNWEDLSWNSKILDNMLLQEAKQKGIILPTRKYAAEYTDDVAFEGAFRRCDIEDDKGNVLEKNTGLHKDIFKLDLSGAYPSAIVNFCLDVQNIKENEGTNVNGTKFVQNQNALLPTMARKLLHKKDELKKQLKLLDPESKEAKDLQSKYDAIKSVVNSLFGICGLKIFRLFNIKVASSITFLIRDLLHYVEDKLKEQGMKVIYIDTDSVFVKAKDNPKDLCNQLIKQWAKERYNKDIIDISFDLEGKYEKIFIVSLCHYKGYLNTSHGVKEEVKGIEARRADSSKFMKEFQTNLLEKVMNEESRESIEKWIESEKERIKTLPLTDIGFPCKITKDASLYRSVPVFVRGLTYTQEILPSFKKVPGDSFYYINVESLGETTRKSSRMKKNKETGTKELQDSETAIKKDILVFDEDNYLHVKNVNWSKVIDKNIDKKVDKIFEALGWNIVEAKKEEFSELNPIEINYKPIKKKEVKIIDNSKEIKNNEISDIDKQIQELIEKKKQLKQDCGSSVKVAQQVSNLQDKVQVLASAPTTVDKFNEIQEKKLQTKEIMNFNLKDLEIKELDFKTTKDYISKNHYSHTISSSVKASIGFYYKDELVTAVVYGQPIGINVSSWMQVPAGSYAELIRVFSNDVLPKNTESYCLAASFKFLIKNKPDIKYLISYADPTQGHVGYIYQATNWKYVGEQGGKDRIFTIDGKQVHRRTANATYGTSSVEKLKNLLGDRFSVTITYPKHIYLMCLGNKKECREWYSKFSFVPYPKINNTNKDTSNLGDKNETVN